MITVALAGVLLAPFVIAFFAIAYLLRRLVRLWEGRDVMDQFRPTSDEVDRAERELGVA